MAPDNPMSTDFPSSTTAAPADGHTSSGPRTVPSGHAGHGSTPSSAGAAGRPGQAGSGTASAGHAARTDGTHGASSPDEAGRDPRGSTLDTSHAATHAPSRDWYGRSQFPDDSDDDYLEDDEAGPLDEDAALATLPPLTDEDRALINKLVHSMRLLDVGISSQAAHEATSSAPVPFPEVARVGSTDPAPFAPRTTTVPPPVRPPRPTTPEDEETIPMLTDVVNVQRYHPDQLPRSFEAVDWSELAGQVRENVLERLLRRGDVLLDGQMNHALAPVISRAVEMMTRDMHDTLNRLIRDIVARAVNEEITRLHAEMARQNRED